MKHELSKLFLKVIFSSRIQKVKIWREIKHWCQEVMLVLNWIAFKTMFVILAGIWKYIMSIVEYKKHCLTSKLPKYICPFPLIICWRTFCGAVCFFSTYIPTTTTIRSVATKKSLLLPPPRYSRYSNCTKVQTPLQLCCSSGSGGFCWKEKMQKKAVAVCNSAQWNKIRKKS